MNEAIKNRIEQVRRGEVPEGYQISTGRVIPADWITCLLEQRFQRLLRKNHANCKNVLTISAQQGLVCQRDFFNQEVASEDKSGYFLLKKGDFAYNKSYSEGYPLGAIKRLETLEDGVVSPLYICFSPKEQTNSDYYTHYFEAGEYNHEIYRVAQEGARNHGLLNISIEDFFKGTIVDPPLPEQQKIAEILSCCDQVISLKKHLLEVKRRQKKWLVQKLLDPDSGVRLQQYEGAWDVDRLDKLVFLVKDRYDPQYDQRTVSSVELENIESVTGRLINWNNDKIQKSTKTVFKEGDILFGKLRPYLRKAFVASFNGVCSTEIWVMRRKDRRINLKYLYYVLMSEEFITLASSTTGTKMPRAEWGLVGSFCVRVPSITEQEGIASILSAADREIDLLDQELSQWQQKKKSLMQLLLTGIVRVHL